MNETCSTCKGEGWLMDKGSEPCHDCQNPEFLSGTGLKGGELPGQPCATQKAPDRCLKAIYAVMVFNNAYPEDKGAVEDAKRVVSAPCPLEAERDRFFDTIRAIAVTGLGLTDPFADNAPDTLPHDWAQYTNLSEGIAALRQERDQLRAQLDEVTKDQAICIENLRRESQLACDLRASQDDVIERCAKAVEEWPEAAQRLREHCAHSEETAVSGEDFAELRAQLTAAVTARDLAIRKLSEASRELGLQDARLAEAREFLRNARDNKGQCEGAIKLAAALLARLEEE